MKKLIFFIFFLLLKQSVWAWDFNQLMPLIKGDTEERIQALQAQLTDPDQRLGEFLKALMDDEIRYSGQGIWKTGSEGSVNVLTGKSEPVPADAQEVINNNRIRSEIESTIAAINLFSPSISERKRSVEALIAEPDSSRLALLNAAKKKETQSDVGIMIDLAIAAIRLNDENASFRIEAANTMEKWPSSTSLTLLKSRKEIETDAKTQFAIDRAIHAIQSQMEWGERLGVLFSGLSQGSILLLIAMGLAITYGLMGIINMAHGEMMLIGAYATYVTQNIFIHWFPEAMNWYLPAALPMAFLCSALAGALLEWLVLRHLYGRPLETLLATWGISLILIQMMRSIFGAQNVAIANPSWMSGSISLFGYFSIPWNRLIILIFAGIVLALLSALISRTRLGLFVRGVTQNRPIASCMGVNTRRIDNLAFGLGSGIAGLAGCALSQIGNVGPEMGQGYIVDSFMVVVLGGVGQLAGTVYAAMGLGLSAKWIEGFSGAVLAKVLILLIVIVFIQKRPQGLFALKGRNVEN